VTNGTIEISGDGDDGVLVLWEPGHIKIEDLEEALATIGRGNLLPKASVAKSALKKAFKRFLDKSPLHVRGNTPELSPLAPEVVGFEARRPNKGQENNDPDFVMSVVADASGSVTIPKFDAGILPALADDTKRAQAEAGIGALFKTNLEYYPTTMTSTVISRVIESLGGILVRKTGGAYFVPPRSVGDFETFCDAIDAAEVGPEMVTHSFGIKPGERSFKAVLKAVQRIAKERLCEVEEGLNRLGERKQRSDGKTARIDECLAVKSMLSEYESLLGVSLKEFQEMADDVQAAVNAHAALEFAA